MQMTRERFESLCMPEPNSGCWLWLGSIRSEISPYGRFNADYVTWAAHRWSYAHYRNVDILDAWVLHKCDNPMCVNPDHLFIGTPADNVHDMVRKNRHTFGESVALAKLTSEDVIEIRRFKGNIVDLEKRFGVGRTVIRSVRRGSLWKHVSEPRSEPKKSFGVHQHAAKLDDDAVRKARQMYARGGLTFRDLAEIFGVSADAIHRAVTGKTWKHVSLKRDAD